MVELLPVQQFDPQERNYWGYMPLNFFTPHGDYAADPENARDEFRAMVKALHAADIEVILDVVYNHTGRGERDRADLQLSRGIDNVHVLPDDRRSRRAVSRLYRVRKHTGLHRHCAWTLVLESLSYWVTEMHVDGFRFDLASDTGPRPRRHRSRAPTSRSWPPSAPTRSCEMST